MNPPTAAEICNPCIPPSTSNKWHAPSAPPQSAICPSDARIKTKYENSPDIVKDHFSQESAEFLSLRIGLPGMGRLLFREQGYVPANGESPPKGLLGASSLVSRRQMSRALAPPFRRPAPSMNSISLECRVLKPEAREKKNGGNKGASVADSSGWLFHMPICLGGLA